MQRKQCPIAPGLVDLILGYCYTNHHSSSQLYGAALLHVSSIWSGILPGSKLQPTMIPSYPGLPQWFSTMFFLACLFFHLPCGTQTITKADWGILFVVSQEGWPNYSSHFFSPQKTSQFLLLSSASNPSVENSVSLILFLVSVSAYLASSEFWNSWTSYS